MYLQVKITIVIWQLSENNIIVIVLGLVVQAGLQVLSSRNKRHLS